MESADAQRFSVDIAGLLEALTEQFPEPLLCVRELIQNAADAGAQRIEVDVSFDRTRGLFRLSVRDDGRGMSAKDVEGYLTIGFSEKDPSMHRGRFGVGKLSPYALGIARMVVETSDGEVAHRIAFQHDGSGTLNETERRPRGTVVRVYKACARTEAEALAERTFDLVEERCGSLQIPLFVNGNQVNRETALPSPYTLRFASEDGEGSIGVGGDPVRLLMGGGIVLESEAPILGEEISYMLDSPRLAPTLSRNAVRRDGAFEALLRVARAQLPELTSRVAAQLRARVRKLRADGAAAERELDANDRAVVEWLRSQLLDPDVSAPEPVVRGAPVLETADGSLVSADDLAAVIRAEGRVPSSRVPRTREEISAYGDRGVPVLLLYRDLEDFLERQGIDTVEVDGQDDGVEVAPARWGPGELALANRPVLGTARHGPKKLLFAAVGGAALVAAVGAVVTVAGLVATPAPPSAQTPSIPVAVAEAPDPGASAADGLEVGLVRAENSAEPAPTVSSATQPGLHDQASVAAPPTPGESGARGLLMTIGLIALALSVAAGLATLFLLVTRRPAAGSWLREQAGAPLARGEGRRRRYDVLRRAVFHPIDFFVARGWSVRASGQRSLSAASAIKGYRELSPAPAIQSGVRLDLDRVELGFVDLVSSVGEPHDGRMVLARGGRVLLNRNHPTVGHLIEIASIDAERARILLEVLLATDPDLARGTDPRQVEWDLLGRAEQLLSHRRGGRG